MAELKSHIPDIIRQAHERASAAVRKTAFEIEAGAKSNAPRDTGTLANSYTTEMVDELNARVGSPVEYAPHQEYGTRYQPGKAHLIPAAERAREGFAEALKHLVD